MIQSNYLYKLDLHGRYYQAASSGNLYKGGNQAVVATAMTAGLPTTYTGGLVLYNPLASTVNLAIYGASASFIVAQPTSASTVGLAVAHSASALTGTLTAITPSNAFVGSSNTATGKLYSSASITLPTAPKLVHVLKVVDTGAITTEVSAGPDTSDIGGQIILAPGSYCVFVTMDQACASSSFYGTYTWEEIAA